MRIESLIQLKDRQKECRDRFESYPIRIHVCCGPGCLASGARKIYDRFQKTIENSPTCNISLSALKETGCHGFCEQGPLVAIEPEGLFYRKIKLRDVDRIVDSLTNGNGPVEDLLYTIPGNGKATPLYRDIPFYAGQTRIALRNLGQINQCNLDDYLAVGGYSAAAKAIVEMSPEEIIQEISEANLRGRGGAGFPAGRKWATCRKIEADERFVVCNGDEGDPGAFMDRAIMEGDPHTVLEGMIIAARAVGARRGYIYVRQEYPLAVVNLQKAIEQAEECSLLGENVLGSDFSFDIHVSRGGGAFVCGESSALMKSIAGEVGEPRAKYVRSVVKGLFDKPTVLNNVETFANVPEIINRGAAWFKSIGTEGNSGTKAFSLVGKVRNTGLIEVPMGTTLRTIVNDIGGGILNDRPFKAVQTGGPSGGCLPESQLDLPVDFDSLEKAGSMMGSGGMIVLDDRTCVVDLAKYFLSFLVEESCGKCVPCREGLYQLHRLAIKISEGRATEDDIKVMEDLSQAVVIGSLCGLGKSGPNPFLSTIRYFREEYLAHIRDHKCPAGVCRELIRYDINAQCNGCMVCISACAVHAITGKKDEMHIIDQEKCDKCGACYAVCQHEAIDVC